MLRCSIELAVIAFVSLLLSLGKASAEMGPCRPDDQGIVTCGSGDGAAQVIYKTMSPSKRLAFAWRLTDRPPTAKPNENDPHLENFVVRIDDGTILARSRGSYWDLGNKIARAFLFTAWSPNSHLMFKVEQRSESAVAELYSFTENDTALGPFDLVTVIKPEILTKMHVTNDAEEDYGLLFSAKPDMTIDDQGLLHVRVQTMKDNARGVVYDAAVQAFSASNSLNAKVVSATRYGKPTIFVTVH